MSVLARRPGRSDRPGSVVVEPMRVRHLREALRIERASYPAGWSRGVFESELAQVRDGSREYVVALDGRSVVGYAGLWFVPGTAGDEAHVTNVVVAPERRRRGIATRLLVSLARSAIARGCSAWTLEVRSTNAGAVDLYRRFGFVPAGVRTRYYENTDDAIVMWCHDIADPAYATRLDELGGKGT